ncbi:MAG: IMS domain-containing protein, partial [Synechococcales bacterium]|nr:IMS domain-containing protein [Synechococcales bacterium]
MRIPLDYYRILGLPVQAPAEQLKQAHQDRTLQMPRREYSDAAIASRKALLDEAYGILCDPAQRQAYDVRFLTVYDPELSLGTGEGARLDTKPDLTVDTQAPHIDIAEPNLIGALLILQELGEYELVLKVGRPYLSSGNARLQSGQPQSSQTKSGQAKNGQISAQPIDAKMVLGDIVLTIALACLELGREQWHQGQYEAAAEALETGQELLLREGLFAGVRSEIQADLLRLRPYRILELIELPESQPLERKKGLQLLQAMLQERGGIDGDGNDQSGLSMDNFLHFIQQLRNSLTAEEQQGLFEEETHRPSAVGTYLAVYALLARGFAEKQPALVHRAKHLLVKLSGRQDVHLEQSICALLLGQTEEASRVLEMSQEHEPLAFIREHSQGSPDLLPGLCLYAERWLQDEVFPHFRDLAARRVALKDYFADEQVQAYLEELPMGVEDGATTWASNGTWISQETLDSTDLTLARTGLREPRGTRTTAESQVSQRSTAPRSTAITGSTRSRDSGDLERAGKGKGKPEKATRNATKTMADVSLATRTPLNEAVRELPQDTHSSAEDAIALNPVTTALAVSGAATAHALATVPTDGKRSQRAGTPPRPGKPRSPAAKGAGMRRSGQSRTAFPVWLPYLLGLIGVTMLGFGITRLLPRNSSSQPIAAVSASPTGSPSPTLATGIQGDLSNESAKQVIELWFAAKKAAMGAGYASEQLDLVLVDPKLSEWKNESANAQRDGAYVEYEHAVQVDKVEVESQS